MRFLGQKREKNAQVKLHDANPAPQARRNPIFKAGTGGRFSNFPESKDARPRLQPKLPFNSLFNKKTASVTHHYLDRPPQSIADYI
jgi:hypothetical protein